MAPALHQLSATLFLWDGSQTCPVSWAIINHALCQPSGASSAPSSWLCPDLASSLLPSPLMSSSWLSRKFYTDWSWTLLWHIALLHQTSDLGRLSRVKCNNYFWSVLWVRMKSGSITKLLGWVMCAGWQEEWNRAWGGGGRAERTQGGHWVGVEITACNFKSKALSQNTNI